MLVSIRRSAATAALCVMPLTQPALAAERCTDDAMIVFDGSGSMSEMGFNFLDEPRIFEARRAIRRSVPSIAQVRRLGLLIYGPGGQEVCSNIDLRFRPMPLAAPAIIEAVDALAPAGETPLTDAVRQAADVLIADGGSGAVVLMTDGKETCGGSPCQMAAELATEAPGLTVHVIGFKVRSDFFSWNSQDQAADANSPPVAGCLAEQTGGKYVGAETVDELVTALLGTLGCDVFSRVDKSKPVWPARS